MLLTHQKLLERFVRAELHLIGEVSGNFQRDWKALIEEIEPYAAEHGLSTACLDETRNDLARFEDDDE